MSAVPLPDLKKHLGITHTRDDDELQQTLDAAESWAAKYIGVEALGVGGRTLKVHPNGRNLVLPVTHLASVTSLTDPDGVEATFDADDDVNLLSGIVTVPYLRRGAWTVVATFPTDIPADVRFGVLVIAEHLWQTQRVSGQTENRPPGFGGGAASTPNGGSTGYAIPNRAKTMLQPHRQIPFA